MRDSRSQEALITPWDTRRKCQSTVTGYGQVEDWYVSGLYEVVREYCFFHKPGRNILKFLDLLFIHLYKKKK